VNTNLLARDELLRDLKHNLHQSNNRMKQFADAKQREEQSQVGDWVYLKLQPYRQNNAFRRAHQKLANKYFVPFQIVVVVRPVAYRLALLVDSKVHPIFYVSLTQMNVGEHG
jgi:hypothetical protein